MSSNKHSALILAKPGQLRDSMRVLLTTLQQVATICLTDDWQAAKRTGFLPTLAVLDLDLPVQEQVSIYKALVSEWPSVQTLVLTDTEKHRQELKAAGAKVVFLRGAKAATLLESLETQLNTC